MQITLYCLKNGQIVLLKKLLNFESFCVTRFIALNLNLLFLNF